MIEKQREAVNKILAAEKKNHEGIYLTLEDKITEEETDSILILPHQISALIAISYPSSNLI